MKRKIFTYSTFVLLIGLTACTQDTPPTDEAEGTPMTFTATGLNFPEVCSRATVDGDWMGVSTVAVKIGDEVKEYTVTSISGDNTSATLKSDNPFYITMTETKTVSAWYPYTDVTSTDMPEVVVKANQSSEGFAQSDYIEANQTVSYGTTSLNFTHRTARIKVKLVPGDGFNTVKGAKLSFFNMSNVENNQTSINSHVAGDNVYEVLVAPQTLAINKAFICVELDNNFFVYPTEENLIFEAGKRYSYTLRVNSTELKLEEVSIGEWTDSQDSEEVTSIICKTDLSTAKVGDLVTMSGNLIDVNDVNSLTEEQKKLVVGIVFYVGHNGNDKSDYTSTGIGKEQCHGYAVALNDATNEACLWSEESASLGLYPQDVNNNSSPDSDWGGYDYTQKIKERGVSEYWYPATYYAVVDYDRKVKAPVNSSGWFLPSIGQMWQVHTLRNTLFSNVGDGLNKQHYWSSSEYSESPIENVLLVNNDSSCGIINKSNVIADVRPVFAF